MAPDAFQFTVVAAGGAQSISITQVVTVINVNDPTPITFKYQEPWLNGIKVRTLFSFLSSPKRRACLCCPHESFCLFAFVLSPVVVFVLVFLFFPFSSALLYSFSCIQSTHNVNIIKLTSTFTCLSQVHALSPSASSDGCAILYTLLLRRG